MTSYPITDPAEIEKLPDGAYIAVDGTTLLKRCTGLFACATCVWSVEMIVEDLGGIASRLVPESEIPDYLNKIEPWMTERKVNRHLRNELGEAEAQRDRAVDLLREVAPYLERHAQILHDRINAFLAEQPCPVKQRIDQDFAHALKETQQPCQRCGGEGVVPGRSTNDHRGRVKLPCPDCRDLPNTAKHPNVRHLWQTDPKNEN